MCLLAMWGQTQSKVNCLTYPKSTYIGNDFWSVAASDEEIWIIEERDYTTIRDAFETKRKAEYELSSLLHKRERMRRDHAAEKANMGDKSPVIEEIARQLAAVNDAIPVAEKLIADSQEIAGLAVVNEWRFKIAEIA